MAYAKRVEESWPIDVERVSEEGFVSHIALYRPQGCYWRIRAFAWSPEREVFREFDTREQVRDWIEAMMPWAVYADVEYAPATGPADARKIWVRDEQTEFLDWDVLDIIPT